MKDQDFGVHEILTEDIYLAFGTGFCVSGLRDSFGLSRTAGIISGVIFLTIFATLIYVRPLSRNWLS